VNPVELILLITFSFLPPIFYVIWIRNTERYNLESWYPIALCFIWGATVAVIASLILEILLSSSLSASITNITTLGFISAVVIAPFAEELTKPLALNIKLVRRELDEIEDGFIYGATAGLGFAATENLLYGSIFIKQGFIIFIILILVRSIGGCLLHASATAFTGYGITRSIIQKTPYIQAIPYLLLAMFLHGLFNFLVSFETIGVFSGLLLALILSMISIIYIRKKIQIFDSQNIIDN